MGDSLRSRGMNILHCTPSAFSRRLSPVYAVACSAAACSAATRASTSFSHCSTESGSSPAITFLPVRLRAVRSRCSRTCVSRVVRITKNVQRAHAHTLTLAPIRTRARMHARTQPLAVSAHPPTRSRPLIVSAMVSDWTPESTRISSRCRSSNLPG